MRALLVAGGLCVVAAVGCSSDKESETPLPFEVGPTTQTTCGYGAPLSPVGVSETAPPFFPVEAFVQGDEITIRHTRAYYPCEAQVRFELVLSSNMITAQEVITNGDGPSAACRCPISLEVKLSHVQPGPYDIHVVDASGNLVGTAQVTVGTIEVGPTEQSQCNGQPTSSLGELVVSRRDDGRVTFTHTNAGYNCADLLRMDVTVAHNIVEIREVITNPDGPKTFCDCKFDLSTYARGLVAGAYVAKLYNSHGDLVGTANL